MLYIKSLAIGLVAAFSAAAIYVLAVIGYFMLLPWLAARITDSGGGGIGVAVESGSVFTVALVAFVVGAYWRFRKR